MATFSLTGIQLVSNTTPELFIANEALVEGELFYLDTDNLANRAVNTAAATDAIAGIAFQDAAIGNQVVGIPTGATIRVSNTLIATEVLILAAILGDVMLSDEILATQFLSVFGTVTKISPQFEIQLDFNNTGTVKV